VLGYDALQIGLAFLPVTVSMGLLSIRYSERLVTRFGARALLVPGLALIGAGLIVFSQSPVHATYLLNVMPAMTLLGIGGGICFPALMNVGMAGVEPEDAGLASGLLNTGAQAGGALGLAVLATVAGSRSSFCAPALVKTTRSGSSQQNQTGTAWERPSGRVEPNQRIRSSVNRCAV
jgi:MFS family permease